MKEKTLTNTISGGEFRQKIAKVRAQSRMFADRDGTDEMSHSVTPFSVRQSQRNA